ncbi:MAG: DUF6978 family protein [Microcoleaceae cyanobacterium]
MTLGQAEFESIINNTSKHIDGDILWKNDLQHELLVKFKADINSELDCSLYIVGTYNLMTLSLSYHLIFPPYGRIYALDLGKYHRNPDGQMIGEKHKHRWSEIYRDKQTYEPEDITATQDNPVAVWEQFCQEAIIIHNGIMNNPPAFQGDLFL